MSIENELLNLARLCRSQARLTRDRAVKQALRTLGEHYESEARKLQSSSRHIYSGPTRPEKITATR